MSINDLSKELLENILSFLPPSDRLKCTLISRRLAEVFNASPFINDVWLNLRRYRMDEAEALFSNSNRQYRNVRLYGVNLFKYNPAFWMKIGMGLRELELNDCNWSSEVIYRVIVACPNLESLAIYGGSDSSSEVLSTAARWTELLRISSNTLRVLLVEQDPFFDRETYEALVDCTMLRYLRIFLSSEIDDDLLRGILRNCSQLEILDLDDNCNGCLSHRALMPILELTKLRGLHLCLDLRTSSDPRVSNEFLRNLGGLSSLESLTLRSSDINEGIGVVKETSFQNWANLRNLRYLELHDVHWTANCLTTFPLNLRRLRQLLINMSMSCDDGAATLAQLCESERTIIDCAISSRSDRSEGRIESSCLESLTMIGVPLTDVGLTCIVAHHSRLKELTLWRCNNITNAGLVYLLQHEPLLEELNIRPTDDSVLEALEMLCPRLRSLDIQYCPGISRSAVDVFRSRRPKVSVRF